MDDLECELDAEFYEYVKKDMSNLKEDNSKYDTGPLPRWIDTDAILEQKIEDIRENDTAFAMFINHIRERENFYQKAMETAAKANKKLSETEIKAKDRKLAVIIMTSAEIITSIGVGGLFTKYAPGFAVVVLVGIMMTALSLYLNFRK